MSFMKRMLATKAPGAVILIRVMTGGVFLSEGIQKFLFPDILGVGRFTKIGIPAPEITAPFVGGVEVVFGVMLLFGLLTRLATVPLLIDIIAALISTSCPSSWAKGSGSSNFPESPAMDSGERQVKPEPTSPCCLACSSFYSWVPEHGPWMHVFLVARSREMIEEAPPGDPMLSLAPSELRRSSSR